MQFTINFRVLLTIHHTLDRDSGAPGADMAMADELRSLGCKVRLLSHNDLPNWARGRLALFVFPILVAIITLLERNRWDIVDFASHDGWLATLLPRYLRPPLLVFHSHGLEQFEHIRLLEEVSRDGSKLPMKYWFYRGSIHLYQIAIAARCADLVIFLNNKERDLAVEKIGLRRNRTTITFNGLDKSMLSGCLDAAFVHRDGSFNIAFIGSYIRRKGIEFMVPAVVNHMRQHTDTSLLLLGTGKSKESVLGDFPEDLSSRISVIPKFSRNELPRLLKNSHIFLLPSLSEAFGMAALEAMACGLVPIVTRGHGFEEYVFDGQNGLLIERASVAEIELALKKLNLDRAMWRHLCLGAKATAKTFTWERAGRMRLEMYEIASERILGRKPVHHSSPKGVCG